MYRKRFYQPVIKNFNFQRVECIFLKQSQKTYISKYLHCVDLHMHVNCATCIHLKIHTSLCI